MGFKEDLANWRVQRRQEALKYQAEELRQNHSEAVQARDQAIANNNLDEAAEYDDVVLGIEQEWAQHFPPAPPRHAGWENWCKQHKSWSERWGAQGKAAVEGCLQYMQRPKTGSNDPRQTGMGMSVQKAFSPEGLKVLEDLLELHGPQYFGVQYHQNEKDPSANDACEASFGNRSQKSVDTYNKAWTELARQGRIGNQQK
jgi:hypothetical protein